MIYGMTSKQPTLFSFIFPILLETGISVLYADDYFASVLRPTNRGYQRIVHTFGTHLCLNNGELNKKALHDLLKDSTNRQTFHRLLYGSIREEMFLETERIAEGNPHQRFAWVFPFTAYPYFQQDVKRMLVLTENSTTPFTEEKDTLFVLNTSLGEWYVHDEMNRFLVTEKNA